MAASLYLDTDAFRAVCRAFRAHSPPDHLRSRVVLSPITICEVLAQLASPEGGNILEVMRSLHQWIDKEHGQLLPWPDAALSELVLGVKREDPFFDAISTSLNICLNATDISEVREASEKLKVALEEIKDFYADHFSQLMNLWRANKPGEEEFREVFLSGMAQRLQVDERVLKAANIPVVLSAYYNFEFAKLNIGAANHAYNARKHANDLLDAEQLVYLADPRLHFVTCDRGYKDKVAASEQSRRIHSYGPEILARPEDAEAMIEQVTS
jgi:hypothetical protein